MTYTNTYKVGDLIRFPEERRPYRVKARSDRYLICTKPFNVRKTVIYTIVDFERGVRGPDNMIFGMGYETDADVFDRFQELTLGEIEVSHRRSIPLVLV
jgi:hypothetical protein